MPGQDQSIPLPPSPLPGTCHFHWARPDAGSCSQALISVLSKTVKLKTRCLGINCLIPSVCPALWFGVFLRGAQHRLLSKPLLTTAGYRRTNTLFPGMATVQKRCSIAGAAVGNSSVHRHGAGSSHSNAEHQSQQSLWHPPCPWQAHQVPPTASKAIIALNSVVSGTV